MIETERLKLIPCNKNHFEALLKSEQELAKLLGGEVAENWMPFPEAIPFAYEALKNNSEGLDWGMYLFVQKADNKLVGSGGFKGATDKSGMVEIGYAVSPEFQKQGLATEAAQGMIDYAFSHSFVKTVDAHTLAEENASTKVLQKCGMKKIAEKFDADDGDIWHWRLLREELDKDK